MDGISKQIIRERLITKSTWITTSYTELAQVAAIVGERFMRYIVHIYLNGNQQKKVGIEISTLNEAGTAGTASDHTTKYSHINVPAADNVQIPNGSLDIEDPIFTMEGGTRGPYGRCLDVGHSVNCTVEYWDNDI